MRRNATGERGQGVDLLKFVWATGSHKGRVREGNEDAALPEDSGAGSGPVVIAVADGMGGHVAGEVASRLAIDAVAATEDSAEERVQAGNEAILEFVGSHPELAGMGTTLTVAIFNGDGTLALGHVGDTRAYLLRGGELRQLTRDHTVVAELVELGHLSADAAERHPQRHLLTRTLGLGPVDIDTEEATLQNGDRVLLCSDGLTTMLVDSEIAQVLADSDDVESAVWALIEAANSAGGMDNTTVAVVDVGP